MESTEGLIEMLSRLEWEGHSQTPRNVGMGTEQYNLVSFEDVLPLVVFLSLKSRTKLSAEHHRSGLLAHNTAMWEYFYKIEICWEIQCFFTAFLPDMIPRIHGLGEGARRKRNN